MNPLAVEKARSRLRLAIKATEELKECKDFQSFNDTWYVFLTSAKNIWTVLEQGAKSSSHSTRWFGERAKERKSDPLLQYVYQARNDDEHGLEPVTHNIPGGLAIGVLRPGSSQAIRLDGTTGPGGLLRVTSLDGKPVYIEQTLPHVALAAVTVRGVQYHPPMTHLGNELTDGMPLAVASLAVTYFHQLVAEAASCI